jgi:uncharacterized membrane protein YphA (DoxX/SURF4 family)
VLGELGSKRPLKEIIMSDWAYRLVRWFYAILFLYAGASKLFDTASFAIVIEAFGVVPESWAMPISVCLPLVEIIAALGLLFDIRGSVNLVAGLLLLFLTIVGYGVWMGLDIDCGCFGPADPEGKAYAGLRPALHRNIVLLAGILYLYFWHHSRADGAVRMKPVFRRFLYKEGK